MHGTAQNDETTALTSDDTKGSVDPPVVLAAFRGAVIGFVLVAAAMTWVGLAADLGFGGAIGLGVFVGIWGGVGFGAMLTAARCVARAEDDRMTV